MDRIPVIALKGKGGSGKSTAAKYLETRGYVQTSFAAPLRKMLKAIGLSDKELSGALKETPCAKLSGRSPREAMQMLGTEWGRALHPNFWVNRWRDTASDILDQDGFGVVVDDCRFPNEAETVRALGGFVIEILPAVPPEDGTGVGIAGHVSETQDFDPDILVINDGKSLDDFYASLDEAIEVLKREAADEPVAL
ncbi:MAG TPA: deoxynucleotide monophosphate kinase [Xanthobacteraceae bacterium]|nr:deoxynucleotide monophosphate kinase [Xanthobacteraceae bacterium]